MGFDVMAGDFAHLKLLCTLVAVLFTAIPRCCLALELHVTDGRKIIGDSSTSLITGSGRLFVSEDGLLQSTLVEEPIRRHLLKRVDGKSAPKKPVVSKRRSFAFGAGCPNYCNGRGLCVNGQCSAQSIPCRCTVAWSGSKQCDKPLALPCNQKPIDTRDGWVFSAATLEDDLVRQRVYLCHALKLYSSRCTAPALRNVFRGLSLPPKDPILNITGKTCALVGSSDALLGCTMGAEIDAHEVVVRLNDAPTAGFEKNVGSRTDVRFQGMARHNYREGGEWTINLSAAILFSGGSRNLLTYPELAGKQGYYTTTPGQSNLQLSFGWKTIHALLHLCSKLTIYGFTMEQNGVGAPPNGFGHYYPKWYYSKAYNRWLLARLGQPDFVKDQRKWWLFEKRKQYMDAVLDPATLQQFKASLAPAEYLGRFTAASHFRRAREGGFAINCTTAWTNHCISEEARCLAVLAKLPNVQVKCAGSGRGNNM
eukprot:jgi/Mesvir1/14239/Mv09677-RA.2